jgi:hypothetical protein
LNRNGGSIFIFDAFSSREPVSTSLENALAEIFTLDQPDACEISACEICAVTAMADIIHGLAALSSKLTAYSPIPVCFLRAAMQRHSWTNNRQPVISAGLAGPLYRNGVLNQRWSTF